MIRVAFTGADGQQTLADAVDGACLLTVAQLADQPLEGTCEGQMACSTCHVIIDADDFARLPRAGEDEEDMLDLAAGVTRTSRLACQIILDPTLDGLRVRMPGEARNLQGR